MFISLLATRLKIHKELSHGQETEAGAATFACRSAPRLS